MSSNLSNINLSIIGKPNSGKSTLFNSLVKSNISPVGNKYVLLKQSLQINFLTEIIILQLLILRA